MDIVITIALILVASVVGFILIMSALYTGIPFTRISFKRSQYRTFKRTLQAEGASSIHKVIKLSKDDEIICAAIMALGSSKDESSVNTLIDIMESGELLSKSAAAWSLGNTGSKNAVPYLINSFSEAALSPHMEPTDSILPTEEDGNKIYGHGKYVPLITNAANAIIRIGSTAESSVRELLFSKSIRERGIAAHILSKIGTENSAHQLEAAYSEEMLFPVGYLMRHALDKILNENICTELLRDAVPLFANHFELGTAKDIAKNLKSDEYYELERYVQGNDYDSKSLVNLAKDISDKAKQMQ